MSRTEALAANARRSATEPQLAAVDPISVRNQLAAILRSQCFSASLRLRRLLSFTTEQTLDGFGQDLKEFRLGMDVFDRDASYDPRIDPIVRVQASKLRTKLRDYYNTEGAEDSLIIEIPKGCYVPVYRSRATASASLTPPQWNTARVPAGGSATGSALAVIPFVDLSQDRDQGPFCDGLTEELINAVSNVPGLRVVSRTSSFALKGTVKDIRDIGAQLGVDMIVEGSVRKATGRLRITVQLSDARDGYTLWSEVHDAELGDILVTQEKIAGSIAGRLASRNENAGG